MKSLLQDLREFVSKVIYLFLMRVKSLTIPLLLQKRMRARALLRFKTVISESTASEVITIIAYVLLQIFLHVTESQCTSLSSRTS